MTEGPAFALVHTANRHDRWHYGIRPNQGMTDLGECMKHRMLIDFLKSRRRDTQKTKCHLLSQRGGETAI